MAKAIKIDGFNVEEVARLTGRGAISLSSVYGRYMILGDSGDAAPWFVLSAKMFHRYYSFVFPESQTHFVEVRKKNPRPGL